MLSRFLMNIARIFNSHFLDFARFAGLSLKSITLKKFMNLLSVYFCYKYLKSDKVLGYPTKAFVEPTNLCNLQCPLCPVGSGKLRRPRGMMSFSKFMRIIDELGPYLFHLTLHNYGEPFLNKHIYNFIIYAKKKRIYVDLSTNGMFFRNKSEAERLVKSGLDYLVISLDGASQKTLSLYRQNANFEQIINGIRMIVDEKIRINSFTPIIELQFIVMRHNEHEIPEVKELALKLKVDELRFKKVAIDPLEPCFDKLVEKYLPTKERYTRYKKSSNGKITLDMNIKNECRWLWSCTIINQDGSVVPCCYDSETFILGNIFEENFKKIWNNQKYRYLRRKVLTDRKSIPLCSICADGVKSLYA